MTHLSISLFGSVSVTLADQPVRHFRSDKVLALLIHLAAESQAHRREILAGLLWPDQPESVARHNLSQSLLRLRQAISDRQAEPPFLLSSRQSIQLNPDSDFSVDVAAFLQHITDRPQHQALEPTDVHALRQATELYRGDFLAGFFLADSDLFEEWAVTKREYLRRQMGQALERLITHYDERAEYEMAQHYAWQSLNLDPLQEPSQRRVMRLLAISGQESAALTQYENCRRILAEELGLEPTAETEALAEQIRQGELRPDPAQKKVAPIEVQTAAAEDPPADQPPPRDLSAALSRLKPLPKQQLFGIETAQAKLNEVIQREGRPWLIAIDGIGGIGKTTLANTLVRTMLDQAAFYDIGWVSAKQEEFLASQGIQSTGRPALDIDTLTDALLDQLQDQPLLAASAEQKRAALIARVKAQPYLIVVDNLETVIDYEALLPYLRALAGPSKFLLTSRLSLKAQADVFCLSLTELSQPDALAFLRHEADMRGIEPLTKASSEQLETIYSVVGGNPRP